MDQKETILFLHWRDECPILRTFFQFLEHLNNFDVLWNTLSNDVTKIEKLVEEVAPKFVVTSIYTLQGETLDKLYYQNCIVIGFLSNCCAKNNIHLTCLSNGDQFHYNNIKIDAFCPEFIGFCSEDECNITPKNEILECQIITEKILKKMNHVLILRVKCPVFEHQTSFHYKLFHDVQKSYSMIPNSISMLEVLLPWVAIALIKGMCGMYHVCNSGTMSDYDIAKTTSIFLSSSEKIGKVQKCFDFSRKNYAKLFCDDFFENISSQSTFLHSLTKSPFFDAKNAFFEVLRNNACQSITNALISFSMQPELETHCVFHVSVDWDRFLQNYKNFGYPLERRWNELEVYSHNSFIFPSYFDDEKKKGQQFDAMKKVQAIESHLVGECELFPSKNANFFYRYFDFPKINFICLLDMYCDHFHEVVAQMMSNLKHCKKNDDFVIKYFRFEDKILQNENIAMDEIENILN